MYRTYRKYVRIFVKELIKSRQFHGRINVDVFRCVSTVITYKQVGRRPPATLTRTWLLSCVSDGSASFLCSLPQSPQTTYNHSDKEKLDFQIIFGFNFDLGIILPEVNSVLPNQLYICHLSRFLIYRIAKANL